MYLPHIPAELKRDHLDTGDDTKVARSTLECLVQIGVLGWAGNDETAIRKGNFEFENIVADEALLSAKEGHTTTGNETANTDSCDTST